MTEAAPCVWTNNSTLRSLPGSEVFVPDRNGRPGSSSLAQATQIRTRSQNARKDTPVGAIEATFAVTADDAPP